jgi:RND superfamily putative drug exporter
VAVAVGVLLDTVLVRTVLVPAGVLLIGERVWWPSRPAIRKTAA